MNREPGHIGSALLLTPRVPRRRTLGPLLTAFAEDIGRPLLPWQSEFADLLLEQTGDLPARSTAGLIVARQNGKSHLALLRLLWGCLCNDEQIGVYSAHNFSVATESFRLLEVMIDEGPLWLKRQVVRIVRSHGEESVKLANGARVQFRTRTRSGARGLSSTCLVLDEALECRDPAVLQAGLPVVTARPHHQVVFMSSPGDPGSFELLSLRERAVQAVASPNPGQRLAYCEFAAPSHLPVDSREGWALANPSFGHFITERTLEDQLERLGPDRFAVEHLGRWRSAVTDTLVAPEVWSGCRSTEQPGNGETWWGFDLCPAGSSAALVRVTDDGSHLWLEPVRAWKEPDQTRLPAEIRDLVGSDPVAHDPWTTKLISEKLAGLGVKCEPMSGLRMVNAVSVFARRCRDHTIAHPGEQWLTSQMMAAVLAPAGTDGAVKLSRKRSTESIVGAVAAVCAVGAACGKPVERGPSWTAY